MRKLILLFAILHFPLLMVLARPNDPDGSTVFEVSGTPIGIGKRIPRRVMSFYLRGIEDKTKILELIDYCAQYNFTHVEIICSVSGVKFAAINNDPRFQFKSNAWTMAELKSLVDRIVENGMKPVPGLKLLTHQDKHGFGYSFSGDHPYMINHATYDPNNPELKAIVDNMIDELISLFTIEDVKPGWFHIGHDEVLGVWPFNNNNWLDYSERGTYQSDGICNDRILKADEFETSVMNLYNKITLQDSVRLAMYSDVLIQRREIPHGSRLYGHAGRIEGAENLFVQVRQRLPRDIIMIDWQEYGLTPDSQCDQGCDNRSFEAFDILQNDERFDVFRLTWPYTDGNITRMKYSVDHLLATGYDHCAIMATQFYIPTLDTHFDETKKIIRELGTYSYNTVRQAPDWIQRNKNATPGLRVRNFDAGIDFEFVLPAGGRKFTLDVYGIDGRKVWSCQAWGAGNHTVHWMPDTTIVNGVCIAVLRNSDKTLSEKFVINSWTKRLKIKSACRYSLNCRGVGAQVSVPVCLSCFGGFFL